MVEKIRWWSVVERVGGEGKCGSVPGRTQANTSGVSFRQGDRATGWQRDKGETGRKKDDGGETRRDETRQDEVRRREDRRLR